MTTRGGGVSIGPWGLAGGGAGGLNLGAHCGDDSARVDRNRELLRAVLPGEPAWLRQVHGTRVADGDACLPTHGHDIGSREDQVEADAVVATRPGAVCAVLVADCLPVLLAGADASAVAAAHAGWRGLAAGVLEASVGAMRMRMRSHAPIVAWLGPCIGPAAFEVGAEVRARFCDADAGAAKAFRAGPRSDKWLADLPMLARRRLAHAGVADVQGGRWCTWSDASRFYSFRRDGVTGRLAACVWIEPGASSIA